jgi:hypothetical protein
LLNFTHTLCLFFFTSTDVDIIREILPSNFNWICTSVDGNL